MRDGDDAAAAKRRTSKPPPSRPRADGGMRVVVPLQGGGAGPGWPRARLPHPLRALLLPPALPQAQPGPRAARVPRRRPDPTRPARRASGPVCARRRWGRRLALLRRDPALRPRPLPPGVQPRRHDQPRPRRESRTVTIITPLPALCLHPTLPFEWNLFTDDVAASVQLSLDLVGRWMEEHAGAALLEGVKGTDHDRDLTVRGLAAHQPYDGILAFKMALAGFMRQVMHESVSFDPSQMVITSGATPAVEILSFCLADPGNALLVPSPYYPGWDRDIKWRTGVELIPVPCRSTDNFNISINALNIAYNQAKKRGVRVQGILISNPSNPTGGIVPRETLHDLLEFASEKNIHLISDEIFAGSTFESDKFVSVAEVADELEDFDKGRIHIIYGLSKDLSLAGFRVGVIYSFNENIITAAAKIARFSSVSTPTQRLLVSMLSDQKFISDYLRINRERLKKMYILFVDALKQLGIECFKSSGGFYCWADMSRFIRSYSEKGERKLWDVLLEEAKVNVTPGSSCHCIEPGWFRCCFTTLSDQDIPILVERLRRVTDTYKVNR